MADGASSEISEVSPEKDEYNSYYRYTFHSPLIPILQPQVLVGWRRNTLNASRVGVSTIVYIAVTFAPAHWHFPGVQLLLKTETDRSQKRFLFHSLRIHVLKDPRRGSMPSV